jgi:hypothetical protein
MFSAAVGGFIYGVPTSGPSPSPPPSESTAGWYAGGSFPSPTFFSSIDRIIFATDTATASVRGPLPVATVQFYASGTTEYGWFGGGTTTSPSVSTVNRVTYVTDTATASSRGPLTSARYNLASTSDGSTYSWFGGGQPQQSRVDRITYATDTATATARGPLSLARMYLNATGTTSYGWYIGGYVPTVSRIDRIDYANDSVTASVRGPLSSARYAGAGAVTATASIRGPLVTQRTYGAGTNSNTYGWFAGGLTGDPAAFSSIVTRITYATDTATSTNRGSLSTNRNRTPAGSSGIQ